MSEDRIWSRDLGVALTGLLCIFVNTTLLVPVLPAVAATSGGSSGAGLTTACFYFPAVATQLQMPAAMRRHQARTLMTVAFALLGLPCLACAAAPHDLAVLLGSTAVRGIGFGIATVSSGTLVAQLAPAARRGTVVGWAGLASGIPPVFAPALGVSLLHGPGARTAFVVAAAVGTAGLAVSTLLGHRDLTPRARPEGLFRAVAGSALVWPFVWFLLVSLTRGATLSFASLWLVRHGLASAAAYLLAFGTAAYVTRWCGGRLVDRLGARRLLLPGGAAALAGLVCFASGRGPGAVVVAAGILFGAGYGLLATSSQLDMLERAGPENFGVSTVAWNIAIDGGVGLGGAVLGVLAAATSYGVAFWLLPASMLVAIGIALGERRPAPVAAEA